MYRAFVALMTLAACGACGGKKVEPAAGGAAAAAEVAATPPEASAPPVMPMRKVVPQERMKDVAALAKGAEVAKGWVLGEPRWLLEGERIDFPLEKQGKTVMLMLFHTEKGQGVSQSKNFAIRLGSMGAEWNEAYQVAQPLIAAILKNDTGELWTEVPAPPAPPVPTTPGPGGAPASAGESSLPPQ